MRAERDESHYREEDQQDHSRDAHHARMRDVTRALRFDSGDGGDRGDEGGGDQPCIPSHTEDRFKIRTAGRELDLYPTAPMSTGAE